MSTIIISNRIMCNKCKEILESKCRYDFRYCHCGSVAVDGGKEYLRRLGNTEDYTELSDVISRDDYDFEKVREVFTWKSYGKSGNEEPKEIPLKDLTTDHIEAILETQYHISGSFTEEIMIRELEYREEKQ